MRLALVAGAMEIRLRTRFPRIMCALTRQPAPHEGLFAELRRIEADPEFRAVFRAGLDAAIVERDVVREVEAAADLLRSLVRPDSGGRGA